MSYTTIMSVDPDKQPGTIIELRNSHGTAPVIWDELCQELFGTEPFGYAHGGVIDKLWLKWSDQSIPEHKRAVLMMTYDRAYVRKEHYARAAADIRRWLRDYPPEVGRVNHWPRIAELYESDPDYPAIAIHQTSVSENPFLGDFNEETGEHDLVDWALTHEIYEELEWAKEHAGMK